jgi:hypothetical protein
MTRARYHPPAHGPTDRDRAAVGWRACPAMVPHMRCFFSGTMRAHQACGNAYLMDGVAINGVRGGPVRYRTEPERVHIVGTVSVSSANRAPGEAVPRDRCLSYAAREGKAYHTGHVLYCCNPMDERVAASLRRRL